MATYRPRRFGGEDRLFAGFFVVVVLITLASLTFGIISAFHVSKALDCVVVDKDRTSKPKGGSDMRIYTDNCGNFKVDDSWLSGTFHASDTYRDIKVGATYNFTTRGFRVPFLSAFPNIVEAVEQ